jgi:hypothetical protein
VKRLLVLLALLGVLAAPGRLAAQRIPVGVGGQLSSAVHVPIVVPVIADMSARPERLGSFSLRLQWNPAVLALTGGADGSFGGVTVNEDSLAFGVARLAGVNPAGASGRVTLVNLQLVPLVKDTTTLKFTLTGLYAAGSFADLDSLADVSDGVFCPARGLWGDIDGDGNANSRDALIALSNAVGLDVSAFDIGLGDVNIDGQTNATDALIILSNAVGMDVSRFRVLRIAGGGCSAYAAVALSITPTATDTLIKGQSVQFEAWVADSATGALQSIANPTWKSSAPMVLVVGPDGHASARDTGTAVVTALRGTRDSAQTTVHIVARRTSHWVDAGAVSAKNRLGTTNLPFGSIEEGQQFAQDGDTLRIRLGRYEIQQGTLALNRPVVLIGDTAADGSRPVLAPDSSGNGYDGDAIDIMGPGRFEVQNLAFSGVYDGVYVGGADCVLLRGVRMSTYDFGVYLDSPTRCLRIEHSVILGPALQYLPAPVVGSPVQRTSVQRAPGSATGYGNGSGVITDAPLDTLTIEDSEIGGFYYGVWLSTPPDSTTIRRSSLHDFSYSAVAAPYGEVCSECTAPLGASGARPTAHARPAHASVARAAMPYIPSSAAVVIESSRLERVPYGYLVDLRGYLRRVAFAHNVMSNPGRDVVNIYNYGSPGNGSKVSMVGDSIVAPPENQHSSWLQAWYLDSLVVDSLQAVGFGYGLTYDVGLVRMTNSTLRDLRGNCECTPTGLELRFGHSIANVVLQLSNDSVVGDPRLDAQGMAFWTHGGNTRVEADRLTIVNLERGIYAQSDDSSVTVSNSVFRHVAYPVEWYPNYSPAPNANGLTVRGTTFSGFSTAIQAYDGQLVADSNAFANGSQAIDFESPMPITVTRNQTTGVSSGMQISSYDSTTVVTVTDNVFSGIQYYGIMASGNSSQDPLQTLFDVRRNTVTCDATGASGGTGLDLSEAHLFVLDNQVSGCWEGIRTVVSLNSPRSDSIVGDTVTAPPSAHFGIGAAGNIVARIGRNTVAGANTGGQEAGLIDAPGTCGWWPPCLDNGSSVVTIDSNVVTGGTRWGIRVQDADSLLILGNTVQNLNSATSGYTPYTSDIGGIVVMGYLQRFAQIIGNVVKHIAGSGIIVTHGDGNVVLVDSNIVADIGPATLPPDSGYGGSGIYLPWGPALISRNLLAGARRNGVLINMGDSVGLTGNNIAGNQPYGVRVDADRGWVDALDNWWGDLLGPSCSDGCDQSSTGDSVGGGINFAPFRVAVNDSAPTTVPAGAPRFLARARPMPVLRAVRLSGRADAPMAPKDRWAEPRALAPWPAAANARPVTGPLAERRAAEERDRAEQAVRRAQRLQQLRAQVEARERAQQAAHAPPGAARSRGVRP